MKRALQPICSNCWKQSDYNLPTLVGSGPRADVLNSIDTSSSQRPIPVLYQSGYLTIKGYDERFKKYQLGFPNSEVEEDSSITFGPIMPR